MRRIALIRNIPNSFNKSLQTVPFPIDVKKAQFQHRMNYVEPLKQHFKVIEIPADKKQPDCCFVEDNAVAFAPGEAVVTRLGAVSRRGEVTAVEGVLKSLGVRIHKMTDPVASLEGGDVLFIKKVLFAGLTARTNKEGIRFLAETTKPFGLQTMSMRVPYSLHLKSSCSNLDDNSIIYDPKAGLDLEKFRYFGLTCIPALEPLGANVLNVGTDSLGRRNVWVSQQAPQTALMLEGLGYTVRRIEFSEIHKADAALTCPSVLVLLP